MAANALGEYLLGLCRERRVSRRAASLAAGLNNAALSAIIRGAVRPSAQTLIALADFFQVPADNLFRLAGYLPDITPDDIDLAEGLQLLRQLPDWRRKEALAQLRLQVELAERRGERRVIGGQGAGGLGGEGSHEPEA